VPVVLRPEWQENSAKPCDTGTSISGMEKEWPQFDVGIVGEILFVSYTFHDFLPG
jgi:hypothetical protein